MSTEIKFGETATTVEHVAIGAAKAVREVASDPMGSARKQVKGFERKGAPTARKVNRRVNARLSAIRPETEIKFGETARTVEGVAIGAAKAAREVASDPMGSARKQVKGFERKGAPTARRVNRRFNARLNAILPEKVTVWGIEVNEKLPEKVAIKGLHLVKLQARRQDMVGDVAKRTLRIFNGSFKTIARTATRFEQATELTPRHDAAKPVSGRRVTRRRTVRRHAA
jgi:hypothetical protein